MSRLAALLVSVLAALATAPAAQAQRPFDPQRHLPGPAPIVLSVASAESWRQGFSESLVGAIVSHPDTRTATAALESAVRARLAEVTAPLEGAAGASVADLWALLSRGFTLVVHEIGPDGPRIVLALPAPGGAADLALLGSFLGLVFPASGDGPERLGELEITSFSGPVGPLATALVGDHLLLATDAGSLQLAHALWTADGRAGGGANGSGSGGAGAGGNANANAVADESSLAGPTHAALAAALGAGPDGFRLLLDVATLREVVFAVMEATGQPVPREQLSAVGLDRISALGLVCGYRDGGLAQTVHVELQPGGDDMLSALLSALRPVQRVDQALAILPAAAHEVSALRVAPGAAWERFSALLPGGVEALRESIAGDVDDERLALALERLLARLPTLGDIEVFSFSVDPPAGGLIADRLHLCRTDELEPYWAAALDLLAGWQPRLVEREVAGATVRSVDLVQAAGETDLLGVLLRGAALEELPEASRLTLGLPFLLPFGNLVRADLPDGWTVISGSTHAVTRFLVLAPSSPPMTSNETAAEAMGTVLSGAALGSVFGTGRTLLATYNTALQLGDRFAPTLAVLGVDVGALPPGEAFLQHVGSGSLRLVATDGGLTLRAHRAAAAPIALLGLAGGLWTGLLGAGVLATTPDGVAMSMPAVAAASDDEAIALTRTRITEIVAVLRTYRGHHGQLPDTLDELLVPSQRNRGEAYLDDPDLLLDGWGRLFLYLPGGGEVRSELRSLGADGLEGGEFADADIIWPER